MQAETVPDLVNGFISNGVETGNTWSTEIQCVLVESQDGVEKVFYLAHECRRENVPFSSGYLGDTDRIFQTETCEEFLTYSLDDRFYQFTDLDSVGLASEIPGVPSGWDGSDLIAQVESRPVWTSEIVCKTVPAHFLTFAEILESLVHRKIPIRNLFQMVRWSEGQAEYSLYCPCRYVNFSNPKQENRRYVQPISGYVLVPFAGSFARGYVAGAINDEGHSRIEFVVPRYTSLFSKISARLNNPEIQGILNRLHSILPVVARSFDRTKTVDGELRFFVY